MAYVPKEFGININGRHTYNDFGLVIEEYLPGCRKLVEEYQEIVNRDGILDLSSVYGQPRFENYYYVFDMFILGDADDRYSIVQEFITITNGNTGVFVVDDESVLHGRSFAEITEHTVLATYIQLRILCEPQEETRPVIPGSGQYEYNKHEFGVTFDNVHTYHDLGLEVIDYQKGTPEPYTGYVEIPNRDGWLDLTKAVSNKARYRDKIYTFDIMYKEIGDTNLFGTGESNIEKFVSYVNGYRCSIAPDDENGYTSNGRVTCEYVEHKPDYTIVRVTCNCEPYSIVTKRETFDVTDGITVTITTGILSQVPIFICDVTTTIIFDGVTYTLPPGASTIPSINFVEGDNVVYMFADEGAVITTTYGYLENFTWGQIQDLRTIGQWEDLVIETNRNNVTIVYTDKAL